MHNYKPFDDARFSEIRKFASENMALEEVLMDNRIINHMSQLRKVPVANSMDP